MFEIETGVPIPAGPDTTHKGYAAILRKLAPGESVVLPINVNRASTSATYVGAGQFTLRKIDAGKTRVWRRDAPRTPLTGDSRGGAVSVAISDEEPSSWT